MIQSFVEQWEKRKNEIEAWFQENHPSDYIDIVKQVIQILSVIENEQAVYGLPDPARIHTIDDGNYQGTLLFVIAEQGYQPSRYWYVSVGYGSCSGCDTLQGIVDSGNYDKKPSPEQVNGYMTLALHILQGLKEIE